MSNRPQLTVELITDCFHHLFDIASTRPDSVREGGSIPNHLELIINNVFFFLSDNMQFIVYTYSFTMQ